jgi:hypothetical protein
VEYILLIVIVISLALAVSAALFKPFDKWAKNYIGEYIYCLLDESELPSLGGEGSVSECQSEFAEYTFASGRPPRNADGDSDGSSADRDAASGGRSRLNRASAAGDSSGAGGNSIGRNRRSVMNLGSGFDNGNAAAGSKQTDLTGQFAGSKNNRGSFISRRRTEINPKSAAYVGITGYIEQEQEKIKKREEKVRSVGKASEIAGGFSRGKSRLVTSEIKQEKRPDINLSDGDWSFGDMFRMLFIIVIIIALVLFVASQVMQISKAMEKAE